MARHRWIRDPTRWYKRTCWTRRATYAPRTSGSLGRTMRPSSTASGWLDRALHDQLEWDHWCQHHINRWEDRTGIIHPRQLSHRHREHQKWFRTQTSKYTGRRQRLVRDTDRRHPFSGQAVADVHGWSKYQRALQLVSYLDEAAVNVAQELGDSELYNYDVLVKLLSDRFDPASRVSAFISRFHGRSRCHHDDADAFADALAELCRVGYLQSPPELRQELIAEQFVRGQSDPELKKYLWVVIRTQKDRKLQTLIEVCTDFSSLSTTAHLHRLAEQTFAVHQQMETPYMEDDCDSEAVFAVGDRPSWTNRRLPDASGVPTLQQMFALARRMGYEMRPIARQTDAPRQQPGSRPPISATDWPRLFQDQVFQLLSIQTYVITLPAAGHFFTV